MNFAIGSNIAEKKEWHGQHKHKDLDLNFNNSIG